VDKSRCSTGLFSVDKSRAAQASVVKVLVRPDGEQASVVKIHQDVAHASDVKIGPGTAKTPLVYTLHVQVQHRPLYCR
jgi:hypothetical protein